MTVAKTGVSSNTPERYVFGAGAVYIDFEDAAAPGTLLGATKGGSVLEINRNILDLRPDGSKGPVKGFRRLLSVDVTLKVNMLEVTAENLRRALGVDGYTSGTTDVTDEAVGTGDGATVNFALDHGSVLENSESVTVNSVAQTRGTDYTVDYDTGQLQFFTAPGNTLAIVASYTYISGAPVIDGEEVTDNSYSDNVVLVLEHTGFTPTTAPLIVKLTNVLCDAGLNLQTANNEEAVPEITFKAHYSDSDLATEPWSITYPS